MNATDFIKQINDPQKVTLKNSLVPLVAVLADQSLTLGEKLDLAEPEGKGVVVQTVDRSTSPVVTWIKACIQEIDEKISSKLNAIMHAPDFQRLEASWRGLEKLVKGTETGEFLKLRLLNVQKKELKEDLDKATEFDQSALFKKVYEEEYGTFGGNPYSVLMGDFYFGSGVDENGVNDMKLLDDISHVAAAAHAPFIAGVHPRMFGLDSFGDLGVPRDLQKIFESTELIKWRSFRESEDSRYVTLTLPRILLRLPFGAGNPVEWVDFEEEFGTLVAANGAGNGEAASVVLHQQLNASAQSAASDSGGQPAAQKQLYKDQPESYLWGNSAYALAQQINTAFALYHWCAAIRGVEGGGLVEDLPAHTFNTEYGDTALKCPTEVAITDRRENELNNLGFIALCHRKGSDKAAFFGGQTTNKPIKYNTNQANANARISGMLPYVLAASRFAHYIKVIMRDKIGSFMTRDNVSTYLNRWISDYVLLDDDAPQSVKANYPLREARVDVFDIPGKPGCYKAVVFLKPHFQLDELTVSIRLVAELPPPAK